MEHSLQSILLFSSTLARAVERWASTEMNYPFKCIVVTLIPNGIDPCFFYGSHTIYKYNLNAGNLIDS